jgi:GTP-binding protein LepA
VHERLSRHFGLDLLLSAPSVRYRMTLKNGDVLMVDNPAKFPDPGSIELSEEPYIKAR